MMSAFRYRWHWANGDIKMHLWAAPLIARRLFSGRDSSGRRLVKCPVGRVLF